ncbi:MAG: hypothetical protein M1822_007973 [Bathelium mastoideum]|nr:MAG: hypothetical protein M1822_007973 [Bathelium mastoideum]
MATLLTPPADLNLSESRLPSLFFANVFTFSLALIIVALRFVSRRISHLPFGWDDYLMLPALAAATVLFFTDTVFMVNNGLGKHIYVAPDPPNAAVRWAQGLFITEISYTLTMVAVKFSILALYWRIFWGNRSLRIAIWVIGSVVSVWGIVFVLVTIFDCSPVSGSWTRFSMEALMDPAKKPVCRVQPEPAYLSNSAINLVTDIALLFLPLPLVWGLSLPRAQKLAVSAIFAIGVFDIGVAISRFIFIIQFELQLLRSIDVTWTFVSVQVWSAVEVNVAIICASLASLRPLLNLIVYGSVDRPSTGTEQPTNESRESILKTHRPKQNSGSFFEQRQSFGGSIKSWSSRTKDRFSGFLPARYIHGIKKPPTSEVIVRGVKFTTMPAAEPIPMPARVSRQVSVRKASLKTQEDIKASVQRGFKGISVYTEIDIDGPSHKTMDLV